MSKFGRGRSWQAPRRRVRSRRPSSRRALPPPPPPGEADLVPGVDLGHLLGDFEDRGGARSTVIDAWSRGDRVEMRSGHPDMVRTSARSARASSARTAAWPSRARSITASAAAADELGDRPTVAGEQDHELSAKEVAGPSLSVNEVITSVGERAGNGQAAWLPRLGSHSRAIQRQGGAGAPRAPAPVSPGRRETRARGVTARCTGRCRCRSRGRRRGRTPGRRAARPGRPRSCFRHHPRRR